MVRAVARTAVVLAAATLMQVIPQAAYAGECVPAAAVIQAVTERYIATGAEDVLTVEEVSGDRFRVLQGLLKDIYNTETESGDTMLLFYSDVPFLKDEMLLVLLKEGCIVSWGVASRQLHMALSGEVM